jgi:hypothetical protein
MTLPSAQNVYSKRAHMVRWMLTVKVVMESDVIASAIIVAKGDLDP